MKVSIADDETVFRNSKSILVIRVSLGGYSHTKIDKERKCSWVVTE